MEDIEIPGEKWFEENQAKINGIMGWSGGEELPALKEETKETEEFNVVEAKQPLEEPSIISSLNSLLAKDFPPVQWLIEKLIPQQGLVALSGLPGSYKSWITQHLALAVATGTPLFGHFETQEGKVLIIDKENQPSLIKQRFNLFGALEGLEIYFLEREFLIEDEQLVDQISEIVQKLGINLIIIDSLIRIYRGKDENSSNDMAEVFRQLKKFQDTGASVLFTHHNRKQSIFGKNVSAESMRGSSDILASVDCHLAVDKNEDGIRITQTKLRQEMAIAPFKLKLEGDENHVEFKFLGAVEEAKEKVEEAKVDILQTLEEGESCRTDLIERFKGVYGGKTIDEALKAFEPEEVIFRVAERGKKYFRLAGTKPKGGLFNPDSQNCSIYT